MAQATLDDDDLFGEAAGELREDVHDHLHEGWAALPDADAIWETDADNVLGVLNTLRKHLDVEDARSHVRDAKKWFTMGERADAFDDPASLEAEVERLETIVERLESIEEDVAELASELPAVREELSAGAPDDGESD